MLMTTTAPSDAAPVIPAELPTPTQALDLLNAYQEDLAAALQQVLWRLQRSGDLEQEPLPMAS